MRDGYILVDVRSRCSCLDVQLIKRHAAKIQQEADDGTLCSKSRVLRQEGSETPEL